ncbi:AlwI family type II restriction endonuclease [Campylobacter geochelonis]|uniref:AlwI restriction endonuclease n=1 Tax=Campylobacter geochelonis TaxID=1780362 RepID=A0A128EIQ4_9BACT|nr:AlwI family type II restriction endonuclease [Campylobacter geochelonis]QKF71628.1 type IIS restriction/modification system, restriction endonuclease, SfaNI family [Campylobacter geochelonis]CZE48686.1 AlwI restriction endonuclease [Campylobacter geochelonis]
MANKSIPYQSFCWVIGTTSFRTAKLNLKIEAQLLLLDEFYNEVIKKSNWNWNNELQEKYYDFMKNKAFLTGDAKRKDKDAREKTSGLVDIGLITEDRLVTEAGRKLLKITSSGDFETNNVFNINRDSFIYLKQLLKTSIDVSGSIVRPFIAVIKCLTELEFLSYDEFTYFVPLIRDDVSETQIISGIKLYREGEISPEEIIYKSLMQMDNYKLAREEFIASDVDENLICLVGMNRKSRNYDKPYYKLYQSIKNIFLDGKSDYESLLNSAKNINQKPGILWRSLLFKTNNIGVVRKNGKSSIHKQCPFINCKNETELKEVFFKYLHVFKAMATLSDYFDLNRRYFNITDTLIFEDRMVKLDMIPKYYFKEIIEVLYTETFSRDDNLSVDVPLETISRAFELDMGKVYSALSKDLGITIKSPEQAATYVNDERYRRFNTLIDKKFNDSVLIELLNCFEKRDDKRIEELVTDEAAIPTIFEYVLGIIWYKVSERQGNILDFMKLSLEANLLPKTHAAGGYADIIYKYEACTSYPKHSLLLEATLADGNNQRRMEMEPVSRHLGDYRIRFNNQFDYSLFVSTYLDKNVISDFRYRKIIPYARDEETITGMKIISMDTDSLKKIIKNKVKYKYLYEVFDKYHEMDLDPLQTLNWHGDLLKESTGEYKV